MDILPRFKSISFEKPTRFTLKIDAWFSLSKIFLKRQEINSTVSETVSKGCEGEPQPVNDNATNFRNTSTAPAEGRIDLSRPLVRRKNIVASQYVVNTSVITSVFHRILDLKRAVFLYWPYLFSIFYCTAFSWLPPVGGILHAAWS